MSCRLSLPFPYVWILLLTANLYVPVLCGGFPICFLAGISLQELPQPSKLGLLAMREELVGIALLHDLAAIEHDDAVVVENALQAMRDGDDGLAAEVLSDHLLHDLVGVLVDRAGGFVQDENLAGVEERTCQTEELLLTLRQMEFGDVTVQAVGALVFDQFEERDDVECIADGVDAVHASRIDVVADAALDEDAVLGDRVDARANVVARQLGDVDAIDQDLTSAKVEHAEEGHGEG